MNSPEKLSSAGTTPNKQVRGADRPSDHRGWPPEQPWLKVRTGVAKSPDTCGSHAGIYTINRHRYAVLDFIVNPFRGSGIVNIIPPVIPNQPLRILPWKLREQRTQILTGACLVKPHNFTDPDCAPCLPLLPERLL